LECQGCFGGILIKKLGLCNGRRLITTRMKKFVLEEKVISRGNIGEKVFRVKYVFNPYKIISFQV
jgi:hypothetical protein